MPDEEWPPLWTALLNRNFFEAQKLISVGAQLDSIIESDGQSFLHQAAEYNDAEMVEFFLQHYCPRTLESFNYIAQTPLMRASASGHTDIVVRLLSAGSNPNAQDEDRIGTTALIEAVYGGHVEIVSILLRAGGDPTIPGWMAITAVDMAHHDVKGGLQSEAALAIQRLLARFPSILRSNKANLGAVEPLRDQ